MAEDVPGGGRSMNKAHLKEFAPGWPLEDARREDLPPDSETKYRSIFDLANDAIFLHDLATGAIVEVNQKMTEMYGYTREEAVRLSVEQLSAGTPPYTQAHATELIQAATAGTPQLFEWLSKDRAGRLFWVEVNLKRVTIDGQGLLMAIIRDITDRKRAEREIRDSHESQKTLNALLHLALQDIDLDALLERALALVLHNPWPRTRGVGAVFLADEQTKELVLKAHNGIDSEILSRCHRVPFGACLCGRAAESGLTIHCTGIDERHEISYVNMTPHGHYCVPIRAGDAMLGVLNVYLEPGHARDASEEEYFEAFASTLAGIIMRRRAEQGLREADDQLREQAALVRLGEMAAVVAHEVKNPLAGVRGALQVIGNRLPRESGDAAILREVVARLDTLDALMKDLLLFARPPQIRPMLTDLVNLAKRVSELSARDPAVAGVHIEVEGSAPAIMADPKLLEIVLLNLLLNSVHAMKGQGTVRVSVEASDGVCRINVADTGPGIPSDIRDRIFAPFFTTKPHGTGLGLATARRLVEAHHGRISLDCPPRGGTVVTLELPARRDR